MRFVGVTMALPTSLATRLLPTRFFAASYFDPADTRSVLPQGVDHVMRAFLKHHSLLAGGVSPTHGPAPNALAMELDDEQAGGLRRGTSRPLMRLPTAHNPISRNCHADTPPEEEPDESRSMNKTILITGGAGFIGRPSHQNSPCRWPYRSHSRQLVTTDPRPECQLRSASWRHFHQG